MSISLVATGGTKWHRSHTYVHGRTKRPAWFAEGGLPVRVHLVYLGDWECDSALPTLPPGSDALDAYPIERIIGQPQDTTLLLADGQELRTHRELLERTPGFKEQLVGSFRASTERNGLAIDMKDAHPLAVRALLHSVCTGDPGDRSLRCVRDGAAKLSAVELWDVHADAFRLADRYFQPRLLAAAGAHLSAAFVPARLPALLTLARIGDEPEPSESGAAAASPRPEIDAFRARVVQSGALQPERMLAAVARALRPAGAPPAAKRARPA